ncbi:MAG: T9SS type A sorting domain-containing protein [Saprospiraceae bacterium]
MKNILLILLFGCICLNVSSQIDHPHRPYEQLQFSNLKIDWYETFYDSTVIDDRLDGYSHFRPIFKLDPIIHGDKIYTAFFINNMYGLVGGYVECRNIHTGEMVWRQRYGLLDGEPVEIPRNMAIRDEKLVVIGVRCKSGETCIDHVTIKNLNVVLSTRTYDLDTGQLLSHSFPNGDEKDDLIITYHGDLGLTDKFYFEGDHIRYLQTNYDHQTTLFETYINSYLLDTNGKVLSKDSILNFQNIFSSVQIHPDTLLILEIDSASLWFRYLSPNMRQYYATETTYPFDHPPINFVVNGVSYDKRKILFFNLRNAHWPDIYYEVYSFNFDGSIDYTYNLKNFYTDSFFPIDWEKSDEIINMEYTPKYLPDNTLINILSVNKKLDEDNDITLASFTPTDSLRLAVPIWTKSLEDGKILIMLIEGSYYYNNNILRYEFDFNSYANSYMVVDRESLGIISKTHNTYADIHFSLYPNPAHDMVYLRSPDIPIDQIWLHDISGRQVLSKSVDQTDTSFSVAGLSPGIYLLSITTADAKKSVRKVVVY